MWLVLLSILLLWNMPNPFGEERIEISYTTFRTQLINGNLQRVTVQGERLEGEFQNPVEIEVEGRGEVTSSQFVTYLPSFGDDQLMSVLEAQGVEIRTRPTDESSGWLLLVNLFPFLLLIGLIYFLYRGAQSQGRNLLQMTRSRAKTYQRSEEDTTFDDVAGVEGAKKELQEIIEFLMNPSRFQQIGATIPKGVLLVGPPGTGKTLLARAVAGEAEVPFFSITGSDFMEMLVGVGASRVRNLFKEARQNAPSIIFIDELDSIGRRRGAGLGGGHDEREQTLNQLLSAMDGFEPNTSVIVMAATNRPDILDPALLRPGRFDRQVTVDLPTVRDRVEILRIHARNKRLASDVDLEKLARATPGFSGADLENFLNEAALLTARKGKQEIGNEEMEEARDKLIMGLTRDSLVVTDEERKTLAYHEAGHAVVAAIQTPSEPLHKVSIIPRGKAMGATQQLPDEERYIYKKDYLLDRLAILLGGMASEEIAFGTTGSGAQDDLKRATQIARRMVKSWGMSQHLGYVSYGGEQENVFLGEEIARRREYSETTAREIDEEIKAILEEAHARASNVLQKHRSELDDLADALIQDEELSGARVLELLKKNGQNRKDHPHQPAPIEEKA